VVRVVAMYAGATFVIIDLINNISDPLGLPRWLPTVVILLLIVGFPAIAIFSWIFDFTPDGIRRTVPRNEFELAVSKQQPLTGVSWFTRHRIFRRYLVPLLVLSLLGGVYFFKDTIFRNWERVNRVAREHTQKARLYNDNLADPALVKEELDLALAADPDYSRALYIYALVHLREGDTVLSKQKLHFAVASDPGYANAWDLLATFAFKQDSVKLAMKYSLKATETDPDRTFPTFNMALQFEDRGFYDQAIELYRKSTQMDSTFTPGYSALGALYNKMNRPADAIQTLHRSLSISPASMDNYLVYKNLAESHYILKDYDQALEYLEQSKALQADYPATEKCFARCYEATGDTESSILHWRIYLALETDSLERLLAQQRLDSLRSIRSL
jgi:tetratricopeptide (TPR) repeat protein